MSSAGKKIVKLQETARPKRGEARQLVLEKALEAFSTVGFDGVTTRGLAEMCGVNHSLIIYHFGNKMGLWTAVMEEIFQSFQDRLAARLSGLGTLEPEVALKIGIRHFVAFCSERPELHRIMTFEGRLRTDRLNWLVENYLQDAFKAAIDTIISGQKNGTIKPGNPARLYYSILSLAGSAFAFAPEYELLTGQEKDPETDIEEIVALIERVLFVDKEK